ncbi:hypothetical protein Tco_1313070 [Tanacetum coccineum]
MGMHQCRLLKREAWSPFEVSVGITEEGEVRTHSRNAAWTWTKQRKMVADDDNSKEWNSGDDQLRLRWMIYLVVLADAIESVRDTIGFEYCLASSSGWTKSPVLWAEIGESSLIRPELVQETTDKVFEVGDRVMLKVLPWKGDIRFRKKGKLAPRFLTSFLDDGRGSGSWMFLFVWSGYAAMRTLLWAGKVVSRFSTHLASLVKSWLVQDQTVLGKDYSNMLIADSLLKTIWFINAPCYGNEALASPKANELTIPEQTATGKGTSNPLMAGSLPKTTKPT